MRGKQSGFEVLGNNQALGFTWLWGLISGACVRMVALTHRRQVTGLGLGDGGRGRCDGWWVDVIGTELVESGLVGKKVIGIEEGDEGKRGSERSIKENGRNMGE